MPRVDFYFLEKQKATGIFPFACRLLEKIYKQDLAAFVALNSETECESLNQLLWTFSDISFIPHCLATDKVANETKILLGLLAQYQNQTLLLNLTHSVPENLSSFERIIEIVPNEDNWRQVARQKFSNYKNQQCDLHTHKII